jgi:hypothetical protein
VKSLDEKRNGDTADINRCLLDVRINGVQRHINQGSGINNQVVVQREGTDKIKIVFVDTAFTVTAQVRFSDYWTCHFNTDICTPDTDVTGLLGTPDGDRSNEFINPDKTFTETIPYGERRSQPAFDYCKQYCADTPEKSEFTYASYESHAMYDHCDATFPGVTPEANCPTEVWEAIKEVCDGDEQCLTDASSCKLEDALKGGGQLPNEPPEVTTIEKEESIAYVASTVKNPSFELGSDGNNFSGGHKYFQVNENGVWGWETTASDGLIEVWRDDFQRHDAGAGRDAVDGAHFVELNAAEPAALWQEVDTTGVRALAIDFSHGQRSNPNEQMIVWVGTSVPPDKSNSNAVIDWKTLGFTRVIETSSNNQAVKGWDHYQTMVALPLDQEKTYVVFESLGGGSHGNFLDNVKLRGASSVLLNAFEVSLYDADDVNLEEATITLTNADIDGDTLGLGSLLQAGLTSTTQIDVGKIELRITGSTSLTDYQSIVMNRLLVVFQHSGNSRH